MLPLTPSRGPPNSQGLFWGSLDRPWGGILWDNFGAPFGTLRWQVWSPWPFQLPLDGHEPIRCEILICLHRSTASPNCNHPSTQPQTAAPDLLKLLHCCRLAIQNQPTVSCRKHFAAARHQTAEIATPPRPSQVWVDMSCHSDWPSDPTTDPIAATALLGNRARSPWAWVRRTSLKPPAQKSRDTCRNHR